MNTQRRKNIRQIIARIQDVKDDLNSEYVSESDSYDNIPENLQCTERAEQSGEAVDAMDDALECLDEAIEHLTDIV